MRLAMYLCRIILRLPNVTRSRDFFRCIFMPQSPCKRYRALVIGIYYNNIKGIIVGKLIRSSAARRGLQYCSCAAEREIYH